MMDLEHTPTPEAKGVCIGGVGGSGTRLIADLLQLFQFNLGDNLNTASDNLCFTFLMRRPSWGKGYFPPNEEIHYSLRLFKRIFLTGKAEPLSLYDVTYINRILKEWENSAVPKRYQDFVNCANEIVQPKNFRPNPFGWCWKEPNTHVFLPHIKEIFSSIKYIHVIRNGLDMAYSRNQNQTLKWAEHYGVSVLNKSPSPVESLNYWIKANQIGIKNGKRFFSDNFLIINYDDFCDNPSAGVKQLANFLHANYSSKCVEDFIQCVSPLSQNRYKGENINVFSKVQLAAVNQLGFDLTNC